jgi:RimJ/RimL family protein N-acetyltransferase
VIETERLILRRWREDDLAPYAAMMADPAVANWLGGPRDAATAARDLARREAVIEELGYGIWAVERKADGVFLGAAGADPVEDDIPFYPATEMAWRLARHAWGAGFATEAARAALDDVFRRIGLAEVFAITARSNLKSQAVMRRLGFERRAGADFDHPHLASDHPLRPHVVYAVRAEAWRAS